jgi:hypothetical protein
VALARAETPPALAGFGLTPEMKLIYRLIYNGDGHFQESADYRTSSSLPSGYIASTTAGAVSFTPSGNIASTTVQAAIEELDADISAMTGLFEVDVDGGLMPVTDSLTDEYYELDVNDDIMPIAV